MSTWRAASTFTQPTVICADFYPELETSAVWRWWEPGLGLVVDWLPAILELELDRAAGLRTCYVAIAPEGKPCYMQWVIPATENDRVRAVFGNLYPALQPDEALLEGAFTPEGYRGKAIMGAAMTQVAERALECGARWVITFVDAQNEASLKGCRRAGFIPYIRWRENFRFFLRRVAFDRIEQERTQ